MLELGRVLGIDSSHGEENSAHHDPRQRRLTHIGDWYYRLSDASGVWSGTHLTPVPPRTTQRAIAESRAAYMMMLIGYSNTRLVGDRIAWDSDARFKGAMKGID
jgi:hypothetical protein